MKKVRMIIGFPLAASVLVMAILTFLSPMMSYQTGTMYISSTDYMMTGDFLYGGVDSPFSGVVLAYIVTGLGLLTDNHYKEGVEPQVFMYKDKKCIIALCGDLWEYPDRFKLGQDILFWPIYTDFSLEDWDKAFWEEYIEYMKTYNSHVLLVGSICKPTGHGGAIHVKNKNLNSYLKPGKQEVLYINIS